MLTTLGAGLSTGAIYVLVAVGFNIVFIASGSFNFAQPQFLMVGTFVGYAIVVSAGLGLWAAIVAGGVIGVVLGVLEERIAVRPLAGGGHGELVTTIGWAVVMQAAVMMIWGTEPLRVPPPGGDLTVGPFTLTDLVLVVLAVGLAVSAHLWLRHTRLGLAALATAEDGQAAALRGINVRRMSVLAFAVAGALLGALGPIAAPKTFAVFTIGFVVLLKAFFALAVGGFGSQLGALVGGMTVGIVEAVVGRVVGVGYVNLVIFVLLLGVLLLRPQGLFGRPLERTV